MADEESEVRRMAEIADAINAILEAEPDAVGDTPSQPAPQPEPQSVPQSEAQQDAAAEMDAPEQPADAQEATDATPVSDELDAAIAAELTDAQSGAPDAGDDPFGPVPELNLPGVTEVNYAIDQDVRAGSEMADLSLRMQDTLAEIRNQSNAAWAGADDLLAEMEAARAALVADIRGQIGQIEQATQARRQAVMQELEELESQSLTARDEMEMMLVKYEASLSDMHNRYFQNAQSERDRLNRYREFLQFLLDERGL